MSKGRRRRAKAKARQGSGKIKQGSTSARSVILVKTPTAPFLKLPPEIRIQIYSYTIRPETGPFSDFNGLYHSCRLIKKETDHECAKVLHNYLTKIQSTRVNADELRFHLPMSFRALRKLRISLSTRLFHTRNKSLSSSQALLERLEVIFALHLDTLIITYHDDEGGYKFGMMHLHWLRRTILDRAMISDPCLIKAEQVVFDLPYMSKECAEAWHDVFSYPRFRWHIWDSRYSHWDSPKLVIQRRRAVVIYSRPGSDKAYKRAWKNEWVKALQGKRYW